MTKFGQKYLVDAIRGKICKNGRMSVPKDYLNNRPLPQFGFELDKIRVEMLKPENRDSARQFMLKNFYKIALIPKSIQLAETLDEFPYLNDELDMMLDSGLSQTIHDKLTGKLVGTVFNTAWVLQDTGYDPKEFEDPVEWMRVAGEISNEFNSLQNNNDNNNNYNNNNKNNGNISKTQPTHDSVIVWRDLQFQLIYQMLQREAQMLGKDFVLYGGMSFAQPEFRTKTLAASLIRSANSWAERNNGIYGFVGTFPGFLPWIERTIPEKRFKLLANIPYKEMTLRSSQGENLLSHLEDGMILMAAQN